MLRPYQHASEVVAAHLDTDIHRGLTTDEARRRLVEHGPNALAAEAPTPRWKKFLRQFRDPLVVLLLAAAAVSAGLWLRDGEPSYEAIAIFAIVVLNAVIGFVHESRAESAIAALKRIAAPTSAVIRDGRQHKIASDELVPGDIIIITEGDTIPADARLLDNVALQTTEASLTGESLPVSKSTSPIPDEVTLGDRLNMVFSGTTATYGRGTAVVVATGMRTEMGRIAGMLRNVTEEKTPLQIELDRVGKLLGFTVVVIAIVVIAAILLVHPVSELQPLIEVLIFGVALAVAAVPEGLPAVVTAVLSIGVQRIARQHAIVRRLRAVETLGCASVIATDKTGTLTKNEMTVRTIATASGRHRSAAPVMRLVEP